MKRRLPKFLKFPWYFALFAIYPALVLLANNISEVKYTAGVRPLLISAAAALALFLIFRLFYRSWHRAAFITSSLALLFYSYGHVADLVSKKWEITQLTKWMLGAWLALAILVLVLAGLRRIKFIRVTPLLNILALGLVLVSAVQVTWWSLPRGKSTTAAAEHAPVQTLKPPSGQTPPDIYYIILDSYGRADLLKRAFMFDNSPFIQQLKAMGFYVAECSQSNYNRTDVSLASSLNMDYLQNLDDKFQPPSQGRGRLWDSISHSAVRVDLENIGYKTIAFATGFSWSEIDDADAFLIPSPPWTQLNGFETLLLRTTPLRHLEDTSNVNLDELDGQNYRRRTDFIFESMTDLAHMAGPKFVFIHVIPPHPPFVYAEDGSWTDPAAFLNKDRLYTGKAYTEGYRNQVAYINSQVETALQTLLDESPTPPIIILQGDHAPWMQSGSGKFMILNAYHLPDHNDLLYPTFSPVNTFRLILDTYLGADYPLLEDTSYYSPIPNIYDFSKSPNPCLAQ